MSAIAGICFWDGRPVPESHLAVLAQHSRAVGPDGGDTATPAPGVALQAHALHFDRLSANERQPYLFGPGSVLTWDGRLDNREDLLLTLHRDLADDVSDAALASAAYVKWGIDGLRRLVGDWSLAIWDAAERRAVLARDYIGNRPLHYIELAGGFAWATSPHALAVCFNRLADPDDDYVAGRLVYGVPPGVTPFREVRALRPGHLLIATEAAGVSVRRYWTFDPATIRYRDPHDYTDRLRELLTEAVRARLRSHRPVWAHLSGGFDSSSIVCVADTLIKRSHVEATAVQPLSWITSSSPESDESPFIEAVERWCGLSAVKREWRPAHPTFDELLQQDSPEPVFSDLLLEAPVHAAGDRVVLSGELGDLVMVKGSVHALSLLEPLHERKPLQFLKDCLIYAKRRKRPLPAIIFRTLWDAYAPARMREAMAWRRRYAKLARARQVPPRAIADIFGVTERLLAVARRSGPDHPSVGAFPIVKRAFVTALYQVAGHSALSNRADAGHVRLTFPYSHRPLVEFMLSAPQRAFWTPHASRTGMKLALSEVLPPELMTRTSKGNPTTAIERSAQTWDGVLARSMVPRDPVATWQLITRNYVQLKALTRATESLFAGQAPDDFLRECLAVEAWLRGMALKGSTHGGPHGVPARACRVHYSRSDTKLGTVVARFRTQKERR
jgi:asparagine synthase (glutamine-hydrolysing)